MVLKNAKHAMETMDLYRAIDTVVVLVVAHGMVNYLAHGMVHNVLGMILILEDAILHLDVQVQAVCVKKRVLDGLR
jgi:hypothetical protein